MIRVIVGIIAAILFLLIGYFGAIQSGHADFTTYIIVELILAFIAIICLDRPLRDFKERHL
jgi:quinol-cytochrome oxidoreductase complex cytochrome b subunit